MWKRSTKFQDYKDVPHSAFRFDKIVRLWAQFAIFQIKFTFDILSTEIHIFVNFINTVGSLASLGKWWTCVTLAFDVQRLRDELGHWEMLTHIFCIFSAFSQIYRCFVYYCSTTVCKKEMMRRNHQNIRNSIPCAWSVWILSLNVYAYLLQWSKN